MDYRDELPPRLHQPLLNKANSLPQACTITPIFRDGTPSPGQVLTEPTRASLRKLLDKVMSGF
jgi:hypothetical protein